MALGFVFLFWGSSESREASTRIGPGENKAMAEVPIRVGSPKRGSSESMSPRGVVLSYTRSYYFLSQPSYGPHQPTKLPPTHFLLPSSSLSPLPIIKGDVVGPLLSINGITSQCFEGIHLLVCWEALGNILPQKMDTSYAYTPIFLCLLIP